MLNDADATACGPECCSRPPPEAAGRRSSGSERRAHSACCQKVALNATAAGNVALLRSRGNNAADPLLCHTGRNNYSDGITTTVVAVIISSRRELVVSPPCGGLLPGFSAVGVRSGHTGWCTDHILLIFYAFSIKPGVLNENETLPEMN